MFQDIARVLLNVNIDSILISTIYSEEQFVVMSLCCVNIVWKIKIRANTRKHL